MISCIATNKNNDWYLINKCIAIKTDTDASNQAISNMLQLWIREWAFNKQVGMNYPQLLSPTGNVNEFNLFEFSIRKILAPYQGSVNWFNSHGNWNAYLKNNFSEDIYNAYQASVQDIIIGYKDYKLTADVTVKYGNGLVTALQVDSANNNNVLPNKIAIPTIKTQQKDDELPLYVLQIKLFTGTTEPLPVGTIIVRYVINQGALDVKLWYTNKSIIYPESLKNNIVLLDFWKGEQSVNDPYIGPTIICPINCSIEIIGILV
jgi:hypothetical protein